MTGKSGGKQYLRVLGMTIDDEMLVGRHGVHADGVVGALGGRVGQEVTHEVHDALEVFDVELAINRQRILDDRPAGVFGRLDAGRIDLWKTVETALGQLEEERRAAVICTVGVAARAKPIQRFAADLERNVLLGQ